MKLVKIHFVSIVHFYEMCLNQIKGDMTSAETIKKTYIYYCQMEIHLQVHQDKMRDPSSWSSNFFFEISEPLVVWTLAVKEVVFQVVGLPYLGGHHRINTEAPPTVFSSGLVSPLCNATCAKHPGADGLQFPQHLHSTCRR